MTKKVSLVYMVAWMSSRFWWKIKQFAKVWPGNSTLIEYSLDQALKSNFSKIIFIVWEMTKEPFQKMFWNNYKWIPVFYAEQTFNKTQRDKPWWTVDAVCSATKYIDWPFIVCNWDDIYWENSFKSLFNHIEKSKNMASIWYILKNVLPEKWKINRWIFKVDENNYIEDIKEVIWIEKNNLWEFWLEENDLCSLNIFWLNEIILNKLNVIINQFKQQNKDNKIVECYLPVEISKIIKEDWIKMKIYSTPDKRFWVTNPEDEEIVKKEIQEYEKNK